MIDMKKWEKVSGLRIQCEHNHLNYIHLKCQQTPVKESFEEERIIDKKTYSNIILEA